MAVLSSATPTQSTRPAAQVRGSSTATKETGTHTTASRAGTGGVSRREPEAESTSPMTRPPASAPAVSAPTSQAMARRASVTGS
ncbi:hypothetical protein [Streptomyces sp. AM 2-1-1]|uniref:hypothetical protein n=1 Tax=Streptomyces sp. AM 2-1-1 TaxID=3028709 RepID=UPI0023B981A2|nr:hypothetical protein [Streptomyces sp. AM 2-1-1]WEH43937.1 hypothetical protein PZB77_00100 [Streptomyces sp. AM 2-1-1]